MLTFEDEAFRAFRTSGATRPVGRRHVQQEVNLQHCLYEDPRFLNKQQQGARFLSSWMHLFSDWPKTLLSCAGIP